MAVIPCKDSGFWLSVVLNVMNVIKLQAATNERAMGSAIPYLEILIDGVPLQNLFAGRLGAVPNVISPLGWGMSKTAHWENEFNRFLLLSPPDLSNGRNSILVCPLDADLGCGAYSAVFTLRDGVIGWSDFGYENDYDPASIDLDTYKHLKPLTFAWSQYEKEILSRYEGFLEPV